MAPIRLELTIRGQRVQKDVFSTPQAKQFTGINIQLAVEVTMIRKFVNRRVSN